MWLERKETMTCTIRPFTYTKTCILQKFLDSIYQTRIVKVNKLTLHTHILYITIQATRIDFNINAKEQINKHSTPVYCDLIREQIIFAPANGAFA